MYIIFGIIVIVLLLYIGIKVDAKNKYKNQNIKSEPLEYEALKNDDLINLKNLHKLSLEGVITHEDYTNKREDILNFYSTNKNESANCIQSMHELKELGVIDNSEFDMYKNKILGIDRPLDPDYFMEPQDKKSILDSPLAPLMFFIAVLGIFYIIEKTFG